MDYIRKLPLFFGIGGALWVGMVELLNGRSRSDNLWYMLAAMVIFYFIGLLVRGTIGSIMEALAKMKEKEERDKLEEQVLGADMGQKQGKGNIIDLVADNSPNSRTRDFDPYPVADFIKRELDS